MNLTLHPYLVFLLVILIIRGAVSAAQDIYRHLPMAKAIGKQVEDKLGEMLGEEYQTIDI